MVLVTGGTGTLGRQLVPRLRAAGPDVRPMSRRPGPDTVTGDVATGAGLPEAVAGVDTVVHAARGSRKPVVRPPVPGRIAGAFRRGHNLTPGHADGTVTWERWLAVS